MGNHAFHTLSEAAADQPRQRDLNEEFSGSSTNSSFRSASSRSTSLAPPERQVGRMILSHTQVEHEAVERGGGVASSATAAATRSPAEDGRGGEGGRGGVLVKATWDPEVDGGAPDDDGELSGNEDSEGDTSDGPSLGGKGGKAAKARWAISKQAKVILEQIYQMERFPSAEMRRRLADDFKVQARQVQFWYQNRRQRDARALKAAQIVGDSGTPEGTGHAKAILQQLRTLNEARRTLGIHQQSCARAPRPAAPAPPPAGYPMGPTGYCASTAAGMGMVPLASMSAAQMAAGAPPPYLYYPAMPPHMAHPLSPEQMHPSAGHTLPAPVMMPPRAMMPQPTMMAQQPPMAGYDHMGHLVPGLQMALGPHVHQAHLLHAPLVACNPHLPQHMQPPPPGHPGYPNAAMMHYGAVPHHLSPGQHAQANSPSGQQPYPMGPHPASHASSPSGPQPYPMGPHPTAASQQPYPMGPHPSAAIAVTARLGGH